MSSLVETENFSSNKNVTKTYFAVSSSALQMKTADTSVWSCRMTMLQTSLWSPRAVKVTDEGKTFFRMLGPDNLMTQCHIPERYPDVYVNLKKSR